MMNKLSLIIAISLAFSYLGVQAQCPTQAGTTITTDNETCPGLSDGSIRLDFSDATVPLSYAVFSLTTGDQIFPTIVETAPSTVEFIGLPADSYFVTVFNVPVCFTPFTTPIVVGIDPNPELQAGQVKTICNGDNVDYEILLNPLNDPPNTVFNWPVPVMSDGSTQGTAGSDVPTGTPGTIHITDLLVNTTSAPITATYTIVPSVSTCIGTAEDVVITIDPDPVIVPSQTKTICGGDAVDYEILLQPLNTPVGTVFNWPVPVMSDGSVQGTAGVNVSADPAATLHITDILVNSTNSDITATYTVTPSQNCTGSPTDVVIVIEPTPVIQPAQVKTICSGDQVDLEILMMPLNTPSSSFFDWNAPVMSDGSSQGTSGVNVAADPAGNVHITDVLVNSTGGDITATYTVVPTHGTCPGIPEDIVITIITAPVVVPGQGGTICSGAAVDHEILLNPLNIPTGVIFNWPVPVMSDGSVQGTAGVNVAADPASTLHITDVLVNQTGAQITATYTITPANGICIGLAETIVFLVDPEPVIQPGQIKTICHNNAVDLEILLAPVNAPAGTVFNWALPVMSDGSVQGSPGVNVAADPAGVLHITDVLTNVSGVSITATYSIIPTSAAGCLGVAQDIVISVEPAPVITPGQSTLICAGQNADFEILLTPANMPAGVLFNWPAPVMSDGSVQGSSGVNVAADPAGTFHITDAFNNSTGGVISATYAITPSNGACIGLPEMVIISIEPAPTVSPGQTTTTCSNDPVNWEIVLSPLNLPAGTIFNWPVPVMSDGSVQGNAGVNVAADPAGTLHITDVLINQTGAAITATYTITPSSGLCVGLAEDIIVVIDPEPVIQSGQIRSICSGDAVNLEILLNPLNLPGGSTFDWPVPVLSDGSSQGSAGSGVAADPAGTLHITDVLNNATVGPITATYTVTATSGTCIGSSQDIVITIVPNPSDVTIVEAPTQQICEGVDQTITLATSDNGINYEILIDGISSGLPIVIGDGTANLLVGTLSGMAVGGYTISVTASVGSCLITLSDNVLLTVDAVPLSTISGPVAVCQNTTEMYSAPTGATTYVWTLVGGDGNIMSGQGTESITVNWISVGGDLSLITTGPAPTLCTSTSNVKVDVFGFLPKLPDESIDECQNAPIPTLTTVPVAGATVNWYIGTVDPSNLIGTGDSFTPSPAELDMSVPGATDFLFTQNIGCGESVPATYTVNVISAPNAGNNGSDNLCESSSSVDLFTLLTGTPDSGGTWTDDDMSGAMSPAGIFDPALAGVGIFNFTYQVVGIGACAGISPTAVVTVGVAAGSALPTPDQPFYTGCTFAAPPTLSVTGTNVLWYDDAGLTNQVGAGLTFTPDPSSDIDMTIQGTTSFYATQDQGCGESAGLQIDVVLEGVTAEIGEVTSTYPEQNVGSIEVIRIMSNDLPMEIMLLDDNGSIVQDWSLVNNHIGDEYNYFFDQLGAGTYEVIIKDASGCEISLTPIVIDFNTDVFIPNVFTPNDDSYNDTFIILNKQPDTKIEISNRWGVNVFSSNDYKNDWQAEGLSEGVYFYVVSMNGAVYNGHVEVWRGNIK